MTKSIIVLIIQSIFELIIDFFLLETSINLSVLHFRILLDFVSGGNAGLVASLVVHPFDLIRTRVISSTGENNVTIL